MDSGWEIRYIGMPLSNGGTTRLNDDEQEKFNKAMAYHANKNKTNYNAEIVKPPKLHGWITPQDAMQMVDEFTEWLGKLGYSKVIKSMNGWQIEEWEKNANL